MIFQSVSTHWTADVLCVRAQIEASALPATPRPGDKNVRQPISVDELEAGGLQLVMIITATNAGTSA